MSYWGQNTDNSNISKYCVLTPITDTVIDDSHLGTGKDKRKNPGLAKDMRLTDKQLEFFLKEPPEKTAPNGLTWHHHQDTGRMQLVDSGNHGDFKHTGGMSIWGGGY